MLSPYGEDGVLAWSEMVLRAEVTLFREPKADDVPTFLLSTFVERIPTATLSKKEKLS